MTAREKQKFKTIEAEVRFQRQLLVKLTDAIYTHTRTDMAPDAALPRMAALKTLVRRRLAR